MSATPRALIVLGMHRAGTSALAGALDALGVPLGRQMVPAQADNPGGYWENAEGVQIHERLLLALGRGWDDLRPLPEGWLDTEAGLAAAAALEAWLQRDFGGQPLWAFKDPRTCRLLPLWQRVLGRLGIEPAYLFSLRGPEEVARSLQARDGQSLHQARLLWAQHLVMAEAATRGSARTAVAYPDLLADPVATLEGVATALDLAWPVPPRDNAVLDGRLDAGQRHHRETPVPAGELANWVAQVHAASLGLGPGGDDGRALAILGEGLAERVQPLLVLAGGSFETLNRCRRTLSGLGERLAAAEAGLEEARRLSLERLELVSARDARLDEVQAALAEASDLSIERMHAVIERDQRLEQVHEALDATKALANERLAALAARDEALADLEARRQAQTAELQARIDGMEASWSWRLTRPLRALRARLRRSGPVPK
ncbi:MAG: hypothetical protein CL625_01500 [Arenimonas sp.]|jgi:hypothetical protein|nr:hypothetical protein [Arenimonas sp.]